MEYISYVDVYKSKNLPKLFTYLLWNISTRVFKYNIVNIPCKLILTMIITNGGIFSDFIFFY